MMDNLSNRILVRGVNWLGDAVMSLPAVEAIRVSFPEYSISMLTYEKLEGLYEMLPAVDNIITIPDRKGGKKALYREFQLAKELRKEMFEMSFILPNSFHSAIIPYFARIPVRIGYGKSARAALLTHAYPVSGDYKKEIHQSRYYLEMVKNFVKRNLATKMPALSVPDALRAEMVETLIKMGVKSKNIIGISTGAEYGSAKRWPSANWYSLVSLILQETNCAVVVTGTGADTENALFLKDGYDRIIDMTGKTSLRQLLALLSLCRVFVSNDSGAMHAASALGVPVIGIFGSTSPKATSPSSGKYKVLYKGLACSPCFKRECPLGHYDCLTGITPEEVFDAVMETVR
jgi:heptosyltransferase II